MKKQKNQNLDLGLMFRIADYEQKLGITLTEKELQKVYKRNARRKKNNKFINKIRFYVSKFVYLWKLNK